MLPEEFYEDYRELISPAPNSYEQMLIKAADKLSAHIKCVEELRSGNREFAKAELALKEELSAYLCHEEVRYFCDTYLSSFEKTEVCLEDSLSSLSELLDVGRASLYRAFDRLTADGYLIKEGRKIILLNPVAMLDAYQ